MLSYIRIVYARNEWNRAWLWDVGSLLALINGGILAQIVTDYVSSNLINLIVFFFVMGLIFVAFVAVDVFFTHFLPEVESETTFFKIVIPFAMITSYFIVSFIVSKFIPVDTVPGEFFIVGIANGATLICMSCIIKYYS